MSAKEPVWLARTGAGPDPAFVAWSESLQEDEVLVPYDLAGSIAHVLGLAHAGLVTDKEAHQLIEGLQVLATAFEDGELALDAQLEDVHMNVEAKLGDTLGDVALKLHTGRSRNDQVATDLVLYTRDQLAWLTHELHGLAAALSSLAADHAETPWAARTHGRPAQPATLGFLLAAHALRFHDLVQRALEVFHRAGESPLGSGAVAGSTLPLDPAFTADVLGLRPPRNALLATGTRDGAVEACQLAASVGLACASLAQDLVDLFEARAVRLPDGFTSGSSLMPHKRNPDALELARAKGKALAGPLARVTAVTAGLPLGYHRDLQETKAPLLEAFTLAHGALELLGGTLDGLTVDGDVLAASLDAPGLAATDVAEALVAAGIPFRTAYSAVARAIAAAEAGPPFADALADQGLPADAVEAALGALTPDPARRATLGGPAPAAVLAALAQLDDQADVVAAAIEDALDAAAAPLGLLTTDPATLVAHATEAS